MPFQKIVASKISSAIRRQIEELILQGVLRPGDRLPAERELSEPTLTGLPRRRTASASVRAMRGVAISDGRRFGRA